MAWALLFSHGNTTCNFPALHCMYCMLVQFPMDIGPPLSIALTISTHLPVTSGLLLL